MAAAVDQNSSEPEFAALVAFDWGNDKHAWAAQDAESGTRTRGELEARPEHVDPFAGRLPGCVYVRKRDGVPSPVSWPAGRSRIRTKARCIVV